MLQRYKSVFRAFLNRHTAFRGRGFAFQLFTVLLVAASVGIILSSLYNRFGPGQKRSYPVVSTDVSSQKTK